VVTDRGTGLDTIPTQAINSLSRHITETHCGNHCTTNDDGLRGHPNGKMVRLPENRWRSSSRYYPSWFVKGRDAGSARFSLDSTEIGPGLKEGMLPVFAGLAYERYDTA